MNGRESQVSFIMATHNRRDVVRRTLDRVRRCADATGDCEIIVVDNGSTDGTPTAIEGLTDELLTLGKNHGSCAKALGVERAHGRYIVFLDDDSFPRSGSVVSMIRHFESAPRLAAAGFSVHLPDGRQEGGALPGVFVGCGVGIRAEALRAVGGLDQSFFMQAEEYDLCFRLVQAGWQIAAFDDLHVDHLKSPSARNAERTIYYDTRNNLRLVARYLPGPYARIYRRDWLDRYAWLAKAAGHRRAYQRGVRAGRRRSLIERATYRRHRFGPEAFEFFFRCNELSRRMADLKKNGVRSIVLAGLGKNIYAFYQAAVAAGLSIQAVADDRLSVPQRRYRGVKVLPVAQALASRPDAVVVSEAAPVHAASMLRCLSQHAACHVEAWFAGPRPDAPMQKTLHACAEPSDENRTDVGPRPVARQV